MDDAGQIENLESEGGGTRPGETASEETGSRPPESVPNGAGHAADPEAPFGRRADGTPKKSRAGRPAASQPPSGTGLPVEDAKRETAGQKAARLSRVRPKQESEQAPTELAELRLRVGVDHVALGTQAAYLFVTVGTLVLGHEFQPDHVEGKLTQEGTTDFNAVRDSFANFFKQKGIDHIDPTVALAIGLVGYTAKRATKPAVRTRFARAWEWCKTRLNVTSLWRRST